MAMLPTFLSVSGCHEVPSVSVPTDVLSVSEGLLQVLLIGLRLERILATFGKGFHVSRNDTGL